MSLLMQALRKAERARSQHGHEEEHEQPQFGAESLPSPPPIEGGPAFAVMPDAWRLEPLAADQTDAEPEPPVMAAQEAAHDPVPPQARHEPVRPRASTVHASAGAAQASAAAPPHRTAQDGEPFPAQDAARRVGAGVRGASRQPLGLPRAIASPQRRLVILAAALAGLLAVFAFIYWRAVSGPGPGARLPMVPMPAPGAPPLAQAGTQQGAAISVTPYLTTPGDTPATPATPAATSGGPAGAMAPGEPAGGSVLPVAAPSPAAGPAATQSTAATAPATRPKPDVTIPTPEQLAAIPDPAIRAEAMRDAAERAARQARAEDAPTAASTASSRRGSAPARAADAAEVHRAAAPPQTAGRSRQAAAGAPEIRTAVGENGEVQFVRGNAPAQVAPAVQHGYDALKSGDVATARQQYDSALLQDPNNRDALLGAAAVALREHDGRQASNDYLRLLELDPNDPEALAGLAELQPGDQQANEIRLRGLARQHPESGPVQFALGNLFARQGRWPEAQQSYFRAFSAMPENADYAFNLGVGLDRMNQPRLAQTYYRRALELAQSSAPGFNPDAVRKRLQALETPPQ